MAIAREAAVIVWDEATKTEHFVRRAEFKSEAKDFGFLVPSPTRPELEETGDEVFAELERIVSPEVRHEHKWRSIDATPLALLSLERSAPKRAAVGGAAPVSLLEEKRIAGYDAAVLAASDAGALAEWLASHGYARRAALVEWLEPYVAQSWILTAFKIADPQPESGSWSARAIGTRAVRMTFRSERPFFPYREPRDQRESLPPWLSSSRSLRIFFVGPGRPSPRIGDGTTAFRGKTVYSAPFDPAQAKLPVPPPQGAWLTSLEDDAAPRPGVDELWLDVGKESAVVKPPPVTVTQYEPFPIPLDLVGLAMAGAFYAIRKLVSSRDEREERKGAVR